MSHDLLYWISLILVVVVSVNGMLTEIGNLIDKSLNLLALVAGSIPYLLPAINIVGGLAGLYLIYAAMQR